MLSLAQLTLVLPSPDPHEAPPSFLGHRSRLSTPPREADLRRPPVHAAGPLSCSAAASEPLTLIRLLSLKSNLQKSLSSSKEKILRKASIT
ncbi:hypothetical protein U9M48_035554 [Paspalum notatum var. saurae]|uniref:Uncharacterized protein n=1 Tax=Paspalum notatum var. saurae TaxID=547442 RepID=A0AAQ3UCC9_PASNO